MDVELEKIEFGLGEKLETRKRRVFERDFG